jgi:hypothetical protein
LQSRPSEPKQFVEKSRKKFHPKTHDKFVDKAENTATAKKAIVEPKLKAAHLKI